VFNVYLLHCALCIVHCALCVLQCALLLLTYCVHMRHCAYRNVHYCFSCTAFICVIVHTAMYITAFHVLRSYASLCTPQCTLLLFMYCVHMRLISITMRKLSLVVVSVLSQCCLDWATLSIVAQSIAKMSIVAQCYVILLCLSVTDHQSTSHREAELVTLCTVSYGTLTVLYGRNFLA
jgi:hypothetical protein